MRDLPKLLSVLFSLSLVAGCNPGSISPEDELINDDSNDRTLRPDNPRQIENGEPIPFTLHLNDTSLVGETNVVTFGMPFPKSSLKSLDNIVITDSEGVELATSVKETLRWQAADPANQSIRSVLFTLEITPDSDVPIPLQVVGGVPRTLELDAAVEAKPWRSITEDDFAVSLSEPPVYATFSTNWLGSVGLRGYNFEFANQDSKSWFDDFMLGSADTCLLYTSPSPRDATLSRMPSSA